MIPALLLALSLLGPAEAHHNKGLPHYGYFENYPQVPTDEYVRVEGRWEVGATIFNFQGLNQRQTSTTPNDVKFFVTIYDLDADRSYKGPVQVDIVQDETLISSFARLEVDTEGVYITRETLPASGDYALRLHFESEDGAESVRLPFHVDLAIDRVNWALLGAMGSGVALLFGLALLGRKRRLSRRAAAPAAG